MKTVCIEESLFTLSDGRSAGLVSSLIKLQKSGIAVAAPAQMPQELEQILKLEGISLLPKPKSATQLMVKENQTITEVIDDYLCNVRVAKRERSTKETSIHIEVALDKPGIASIETGIGFFDHMLDQIARHGNIGLKVKVKGDLLVDEHHTVEDTGITLGEAIIEALGGKMGIKRYGFCLPMDDSHAEVAVDLGGRTYLNFKVKFKREKVGELPTELVEEFFRGMSLGLKANIYIKAKGKNEHHKIEAIFKAFAKALNEACRLDERAGGQLPSTKGAL